jgi:hypothetical protein
MQSEPNRTPIRYAAIALGVYWLAILNWFHPVLRLTSSYANLLALWIMLWIPWVVAGVTLARVRGRERWLILPFAFASMALGAVFLIVTSFELASRQFGEPDAGFAAVQRAPLPRGGALVVYQTDCGATCSIGTVVRQERALLPGLLLVRSIYHTSRFRAEDARVQILGDDRARVDFDVVHLRRWLYL